MANRFRFTHDKIAKLRLPEGKKEALFYDEGSSLMLRINGSGGKSFLVHRKVDGKGVRVSLGRYSPELKLPAMRAEANRTAGAIEEKVSERAFERAARALTLAKAFEKMLEVKGHTLTAATLADYRRTYRNYLSKLVDRPLVQLTHDDVLELHHDVTHAGLAHGQQPRYRGANKAVRLLGVVFNFSRVYHVFCGKRLLLHNPVEVMNATRSWHKERREKIRINPVELNSFIGEVLALAERGPSKNVKSSYQVVSAAILFMLFTGVRPDEVAKIRKDYLDVTTRSIIFPARNAGNEQDTLKNGHEFHLVLNDTAWCQVLYALEHSTSPYVFSGVTQERMSENAVRDFLGVG